MPKTYKKIRANTEIETKQDYVLSVAYHDRHVV